MHYITRVQLQKGLTFVIVLIIITVYSKKKKGCLSHIGYVRLVSVVYNPQSTITKVMSFCNCTLVM